jgi:hypothetical protein
VEESNGYTAQQVEHSLEDVGSHVELNCDIIQHNSDAPGEGNESKEVKLPEQGVPQMGNRVDLINCQWDPCPP